MRPEQVHPYFNDAHEELIEQLEWLQDWRWEAKPTHIDGLSIRQITQHLIDQERFWIVHIAQGGVWDRVTNTDFPTRDRIIEGLHAVRAGTIRYIDTLEPAGLKAVRTIPADPFVNRPEINQSLNWILWQVMRNDIFYLGQVALRRVD